MVKADQSNRVLQIVSNREYDPKGVIEIAISAVQVIKEGSRFVVRMTDRDYFRDTLGRKRHSPPSVDHRLEHVLTEKMREVSQFAPTHDKFGLNIP